MFLNLENSGEVATQLVLIVILILINAMLAASELSILSSNDYKIDSLAKEGNKRALLVQKLKKDETKFLSTIQVGITLAGFFSSATAAVSLSEGLGEKLVSLGLSFGDDLALVVVTLILSYFTLVFGELFPKRLALRNPEKIAMALCGPINVIRVIFRPIVALLSGSCELLVKLFRIKPNNDDKITEEEIKATELKLLQLKVEVEEAISQIDDVNLRLVLIYRYLDFYSWGEVAKKIYASIPAVYKYHQQALEKFKVPTKRL